MLPPYQLFNVSNIQDITKEHLSKVAMDIMGIPALILNTIFIFVVFLVVGLIFVKKDRNKFMWIWGITLIFSIIFLLIIVYNPNFITYITDKFSGLIN